MDYAITFVGRNIRSDISLKARVAELFRQLITEIAESQRGIVSSGVYRDPMEATQ
jgi:hypothetical protein